MSRYFRFIVVLFIFFYNTPFAQAKGPKAVIQENIFDFGEINKGKTHTLIFKNKLGTAEMFSGV